MLRALPLILISGAALVALDRLTKAVVARRLPPGNSIRIGPGLQLRHVRHRLNPFVTTRQGPRLIALITITGAVLVWLAAASSVFAAPFARLGITVAMAGACCNLWDRLRHRAFVDFICIGRWPAFNVADVGICVGAMLALSHVS